MRFSYQQKNNSQSMKKMYISFQLLIIYPYQIGNHYEKIQLLLISINKWEVNIDTWSLDSYAGLKKLSICSHAQ